MKKFAIILLTILIAGLFVACNQDVTVDAQTYANMEVGTFVLNGQNYATLQEAVNAKLGKSAKALGDNDGVIYLTRNASGPGAVIDQHVEGGVIIDFAGYTYSFTNVTGLQGGDNPKADTFGLGITNGADVTLKGLQQIDLNDTATTDLTMVYVAGANTKLTIEDAPKMKVEPDQYVFWAANGATLTIGSTTTTSEKTEITGKIAATGTSTNKPVVSFNNDTKINASELKADSAVVVINTSEASTIDSFVGANEANIVVSGTGNVTVNKNDSSDGTYEIENTSSSSETKVEVPTKDGSTTREITPGEKVEGDAAPKEDTTPSVAMIGSTLYKTLEAAVTASNSGDTIILLKNIDLTSYARGAAHEFALSGRTLDLNSKTISVRNQGVVYTGTGFTIKNGTITAVPSNVVTEETINDSYALFIGWNNEAKDVVLENLVLNGGLNVSHGSTVTVQGEKTKINGTKYYAVWAQGESVVTIKDGSYTFVNSGDVATDSLPNPAPILCVGKGETVDCDKTTCGTIIVEGGSFTVPTTIPGQGSPRTSKLANVGSGGTAGTNIAIKGGTFNVDPSDYVADGYEAVAQGTSPKTWTVVEKKPVARVIYNGSAIDYYSLKEAVDAAPAGSTVALLLDISEKGLAPILKTLTFDLSGHTWTVSTSDSESNDRAIKVEGSADFTLIDSSEKHEGRIIAESALYGAVRFESSGKLTIKNVTLENSRAYGLNVKIMNGTYEIDGLTVYSTVGGSVEVGGKKDTWTSTGTIKNSTFIQKKLDDDHKWISTAIGVSYGATVKVEGGKYIGTQAAVYIDSSGGNVIIDSGTFEVTGTHEHAGWVVIGLDKASYPTSTEHVTVNGGTFTGKFSLTNTSNPSEIEVFGGKYNFEPTDYLAEGYVARKTGDVWIVEKADTEEVEIKSATTEPVTMSLAKFRDKVNAGNTYAGYTVKLLKDVNLTGISWVPIGTSEHPFSGTFDGDGKKIINLSNGGYTAESTVFNTDPSSYSSDAFALFKSVSGTAVIKNFSVSAYIYGTGKYTAAVLSGDYDSTEKSVTIEKVTVDGIIVAKERISGVIGLSPNYGNYASLLTINSCVNNASIKGDRAAGILSNNGCGTDTATGHTTVKDCINTGTIISLIDGGENIAAGIICNTNTTDPNRFEVINCSNTGKIYAKTAYNLTANSYIYNNEAGDKGISIYGENEADYSNAITNLSLLIRLYNSYTGGACLDENGNSEALNWSAVEERIGSTPSNSSNTKYIGLFAGLEYDVESDFKAKYSFTYYDVNYEFKFADINKALEFLNYSDMYKDLIVYDDFEWTSDYTKKGDAPGNYSIDLNGHKMTVSAPIHTADSSINGLQKTVIIKNGTIAYKDGYTSPIVDHIEHNGRVDFINVVLDSSVPTEILTIYPSKAGYDCITVNIDSSCSGFTGKQIRCLSPETGGGDKLVLNGIDIAMDDLRWVADGVEKVLTL